MEKEDGVKKVAVAAAAPEEVTLTLTATVAAPLPAPGKEPETQDERCYKKTVGEEATFLETAKDYFNQFKEVPAQKHWNCLKNYIKCISVPGKQKVEPVVKDETEVVAKQKVEPVVKDETEVVAKPATAAVESK